MKAGDHWVIGDVAHAIHGFILAVLLVKIAALYIYTLYTVHKKTLDVQQRMREQIGTEPRSNSVSADPPPKCKISTLTTTETIDVKEPPNNHNNNNSIIVCPKGETGENSCFAVQILF